MITAGTSPLCEGPDILLASSLLSVMFYWSVCWGFLLASLQFIKRPVLLGIE